MPVRAAARVSDSYSCLSVWLVVMATQVALRRSGVHRGLKVFEADCAEFILHRVASCRETCPASNQALRADREQAGLTQRAVALVLGIAGGAQVSAWEAGRGTPRDTQLAPLANVLNLSVDERVSGEPPPRPPRLRAGLSVPTHRGRWNPAEWWTGCPAPFARLPRWSRVSFAELKT